jgi:hypothetical protein
MKEKDEKTFEFTFLCGLGLASVLLIKVFKFPGSVWKLLTDLLL